MPTLAWVDVHDSSDCVVVDDSLGYSRLNNGGYFVPSPDLEEL